MRIIPIILLIILIFIGCKKDSNPLQPQPTQEKQIPTKIINGKLKLPSGSSIKISELKVVGANEVIIKNDSSFQIETFDKFWCFLDVIDKNGNIIAMVNDTMYNGIQIDESSTAVGLVLSVPIPWEFLTGKNRSQIISTIKNHHQFSQLVDKVRNIMRNDPSGLTNFERHPSLLESIRIIINDLIVTSSSVQKSMSNSLENGAYIDPSSCSQLSENIIIKNPKNIPFGISGFNLNGNPYQHSSYLINKKPIWIESKGLLGFLPDFLPPITGEPSREYKVGYGNYLICLSRTDINWFLTFLYPAFPDRFMVNFLDVTEKLIQIHLPQGNYLEVVRADARIKAIIGTTFETFLSIVGIVPLYGDGAELLGSLIVEAINSSEIYQMGISLASTYGNIRLSNFFEGILKFASDNESVKKFLAKAILGDARKTRIISKKIVKIFPLVTDFIDLIIKAWDLNNSDQDIIYQVTKDKNNAINNRCIKSPPPNIPNVIVSPSNVIFGNSVNITMSTTDPTGKKIKYFLLKNGWQSFEQSGLLNSGQSYTFTYNPPHTGRFVFMAQAQNQDGAMSGQNEFEFYVKPSQNYFFEDFESYQNGRFSNNSIWTVVNRLPSEVRISNIAYNSSKSLRFIDYDPDIGDQYGYYAYILTQLSGNATSIEFALRIDNKNDAVGIRVWNSLGLWLDLAYYITTLNGNLVWVKYGIDINDPNNFIPIMPITPQKWYKIKLNIDWLNKKYDIYIDGQRKYTGATFIGNVTSAPYFQAVAFIETQCRTAYLNKIEIHGSTFSKIYSISGNQYNDLLFKLTRSNN